MSFAYLTNSYPVPSATFIRREINAHEAAGFDVRRFAIRPFDGDLVDPRDIEEQKKVTYLLAPGVPKLALATALEALRNPSGFARAFSATLKLVGAAKEKKLFPFAYLMEAVNLHRQLKGSGITHLHAHWSTNSAAVAMLCRLLGGPRYSFTVHGPDELFVLEENNVALKMQHAERVVAITEYCRGILNDYSGGRFDPKIEIVHCGLDLGEFTAATDVPESQHLVCIGRLCEAKAQTLLMDAVAQVSPQHPGFRITLIGDGDTRAQVEAKIAEHGLQDIVTLAGWQDNKTVQSTLKASRAMVLPSLHEGLPIVIMESLAMGRPVVSTRINGIPELVDDVCGWLAEPGDLNTLVAALNAVMEKSTEELTAMGREGRARIDAEYDQDKSAAQLRAIFAD